MITSDDDYDYEDGYYYYLGLYFTVISYWPNLHSVSPSEGSLYKTSFSDIYGHNCCSLFCSLRVLIPQMN